MSRYFAKVATNVMSVGLGSAGIGGLINGASKISVAAKVMAVDALAAFATGNGIVGVKVDGASAGVFMCLDPVTASPNNRLRCIVRSVSTDAGQVCAGSTNLSMSTAYSIGLLADIAGDSLTSFINGAVDTGPTAVTFGNTTWTLGTPTIDDSIGQHGAALGDVNSYFGGNVSEVAVWTDDIGAAGHAAYNKDISPLQIMPDKLVFYLPLVGRVSPEPELVSKRVGTITGTIAQAAHPRVIRPHRRVSRRLVTAAAGVSRQPYFYQHVAGMAG